MFGCVRAKERSNALPCPKDGSSVTSCCCSSQLLLSYCLHQQQKNKLGVFWFLCLLFVPIGCKWCFYNLQLCTHGSRCFKCIYWGEVLLYCNWANLWELFSEGGMFSEICLFTMSLLLSFIFTEKKLPWLNQFSVE